MGVRRYIFLFRIKFDTFLCHVLVHTAGSRAVLMPYPDPEPNDRRADKYPPYASSYQPPAAEMEVDAGDSHEPWPPHHSLIQQIAEMSVVSDPEEEQLGEAPSHEQQPSTSVSSGCSSRMENGVSAVPAPEEMTGADRDAVRYWCGGRGRDDRCECEYHLKQPPPVYTDANYIYRHRRRDAPPFKAPPPTMPTEDKAPFKAPPPPPPLKAPPCKALPLPPPDPKRQRITVVESGDPLCSRCGVFRPVCPWPVCSRCGVFRPFGNATGEADGEAQQQEPCVPETVQVQLCNSVGCTSPSGHPGFCTSSTGEFWYYPR